MSIKAQAQAVQPISGINEPRCLRINGCIPLQGKVRISGAKNSVLPIMAASLLTDDKLIIRNMPHLDDVALMNQLLAGLKSPPIIRDIDTIELGGVCDIVREIPREQTRQMRASILALGPLLARFGKIELSYPGGCLIGMRPVDMHLQALRTLGAEIEERDDLIRAYAPDGLIGNRIEFPHPTVGGTENIMMAACLARGLTVIENAALEPEVADLGRCLQAMGAKIEGLGTSTMRIEGVPELHGCEHVVIPDRIETGTYLVAAAATRGRVELLNTQADLLEVVIDKLRAAGADIKVGKDSILLDMKGKRPHAVDVETGPYPGFPTDMQAQFTVLNAVADGEATVREKIFEGRVAHIEEMHRMGADIVVRDGVALIRGVEALTGAQVKASDLRASASLVIAGLVAKGTTSVLNIEHIDRGYQWIEEKLRLLKADVKRVLLSAEIN